jgi:hypothetical protein
MSDLVERVARALCDAEWGDGIWDKPGLLSEETERKSYRELARAAVAIALEEAAKVADENACDCCFYIAAAIRAMIPTGNAPAQNDDADSK